MMNAKLMNYLIHGDERGSLIAIENNKDYPFDVKRVYYIFNTLPDVRRGFHAHKKLQQILICVNGSCVIHLDNGLGETKEILLDSPSKGLYISSNTWREMYNFSKDAVLLVLASEYYDEADYIRNYDDFIRFVRNK